MNQDIGFEESVRERAYYLWENEGRPSGRHVEHWLICEEALRAERAAVEAPAEIVVALEAIEAAPAKPARAPRKSAAAKPKAEPRAKKAPVAAKRRAPMPEAPATLQ